MLKLAQKTHPEKSLTCWIPPLLSKNRGGGFSKIKVLRSARRISKHMRLVVFEWGRHQVLFFRKNWMLSYNIFEWIYFFEIENFPLTQNLFYDGYYYSFFIRNVVISMRMTASGKMESLLKKYLEIENFLDLEHLPYIFARFSLSFTLPPTTKTENPQLFLVYSRSGAPCVLSIFKSRWLCLFE